jgi:vacuolar-type H+-ATPase subunit H
LKPEKPTVDLKESELLDEVYRAEMEIDLYLKDRAREAETILEEAREKAELEQDRIAQEAESRFKEKYLQLVEEAKREAETILEEGVRQTESERIELEKRQDSVVGKILELVLEKKP